MRERSLPPAPVWIEAGKEQAGIKTAAGSYGGMTRSCSNGEEYGDTRKRQGGF
ncbi:MAG: hypothetical protein HYY09_01195 [Firmicutes bacterium]|nr:hypothetical protein [Bacillota bacterium]